MRIRVQHQRTKRVWLCVRAAAALLVLFTIAADTVADSRCDAPSRPQPLTAVSRSTPLSTPDACGTGCVPDCYCCSTFSTTPVSVPLECSGPAIGVVAAVDPDCSTGVCPLPYRPPLALA